MLTLNLIKQSAPSPAIQFNGIFAPLCFIRVQSQHSHLPGDFGALVLPYVDRVYGNDDFLFRKHLAPRTEPELLVTGVLTMVLLGQLTGLT